MTEANPAAIHEQGLQAGVPFVDVSRVNRGIQDDFFAELAAVVETGAFSNGPQVGAFEDAFAAYCGARFCVGVASGLDALRLGLLAAGLDPGDEVIVPAHTFVATFEAVIQAGGRPVLVDVGESDYNVDAEQTAAATGPRTRFLLPVHLYGQLADVTALVAIAERRGLGIIEDACQAHGAERDGRRAGTAGTAGAFSFYPSKNLGAFGDAGAVVTADDAIRSRVRALREHGQTAKYFHSAQGYTARLDTIQAIALLLKLASLDRWNEERRAAAALYDEMLSGVGDLVLPPVPDGSRPVWHLYVVTTTDPTALGEFLRGRGIETGRHYPQPAHLSPAYESLGHRAGAFPVTERLAREALSLPIFPGITEDELELVAEAVRMYFHG